MGISLFQGNGKGRSWQLATARQGGMGNLRVRLASADWLSYMPKPSRKAQLFPCVSFSSWDPEVLLVPSTQQFAPWSPLLAKSRTIYSRRSPNLSSIEGESLGLVITLCPSVGECQDQEVGVGGLVSRGRGRG